MNVLNHREYGDSAPMFEAVYDVPDADYNVYMDIHQAIDLALLAHLRTKGIALAYPTRTLHLRLRASGLADPAGGTS